MELEPPDVGPGNFWFLLVLKPEDKQSFTGFHLVEVAGTSSLQELFVSTHGDAEGVNRLVPQTRCSDQNVLVDSEEVLDLRLNKSQYRDKQMGHL